ncbi:hypothetical protein FDI85_gp024 [Erwinia phage Machina]|uniref:Uncharacterized protein n=2 Tax=Machinavirus machina TaxID=2169990 RepID=A0A1B2IDK3_9CAUD|nr:hypothetical protein BIZ81_gp024 [Erwinia phage vB_EamM_Huxley]YP_009617177.1 hypothetical protein FDI85_gp024 [Erwinia phage Machina]ANZ50169.1 hypothetical protein PARSHIK_260 [Erwinia phage vB_EamM_Parshik]QOC54711.1 hypothetical protein pSALSNUABM04_251 [Salmonella phage pSal-SNUABM-04]ANZ49341.1 hypothetical protein HUXLEY_259 [Erwinia phage vB_EamM_Huxley]ANZ49898.1 hypothetical protein MACHINA_260 [Erwinia phage Machina]
MKAVNIVIPPSLNMFSPEELKAVGFHAIQGRVGKNVLAEVLSERLDTKRKINNVIAAIPQQDLTKFYLDLQAAGATIDYSRTFFLQTELYRRIVTVKQ